MQCQVCWIIAAVVLAAGALQVAGQYVVPMPYQQVTVQNVKGGVIFKGASVAGEPGKPGLPHYQVSILVPPETDLKQISVELINAYEPDLAGEFAVNPCKPPLDKNFNPVWPKGVDIIDGKDTGIYAKNAFYPADIKGKVSIGQMRQYKIVDIDINPFRYNPVTKKLRMLKGGAISVSFPKGQSSALVPSIARNAWAERILLKKLANPEILSTYGSAPAIPRAMATKSGMSAASVSLGSGMGYAIITTEAIKNNSDLAALRDQLFQDAYNVTVVTETTYGAGATAADRAKNIRTWLANNCDGLGLSYVLLIGNPDPEVGDVPMYLYYGNPTDYYYAELTSDWPRTIDQHPEVAVGRIPMYPSTGGVYTDAITNLNRIIDRTIAYTHFGNVEWRRFAMLPVVPLNNSANEYTFGENIANDILKPQGWQYRRLYDPYNYLAFNFVADLVNMNPLPEVPLCSYANMPANWNDCTPGLVVWHTHGSSYRAENMLTSDGAAALNDAFPAIVFSASCENSLPQIPNNLGYEVLVHNAVAFVGGTILMSDDDSRGYDFARDVIGSYPNWGLPVGDALAANNLGGKDFYALTLWGMPHVSLDLQPFPTESVAPQGFKVEAISSTQVQLTWSAVPGAGSYLLERGDASASRIGGLVYLDVTSSTSYVDQNLQPSTKYKYHVRVNPAYLLAPFSPIDSATTLTVKNQPLVPPAPSSLGYTEGDNRIYIFWDNVGGATSYNVKRSSSSFGPFCTVENVPADPISQWTGYTCINLLNGTPYYFQVSAVNQYGQSTNSWTVNGVPSVSQITNAPVVTIKNPTPNGFEYWWTENSPNMLYFEMEYNYNKVIAGKSTTISSSIKYRRDYVMNALDICFDNNQTVNLRIRAGNEFPTPSPWSPWVAAKTTAGNPPGTPAGINATVIDPAHITLTWSPSTATPVASSYEIYHSYKGNTSGFSKVDECKSNSYSYQTSPSMTDSFCVRAVYTDANKYRSFSPYSSKTYSISGTWPITAPSSLTATCVSATESDLAWTDNSTTETGFRIERMDVEANGPWTLVTTTAANVTSFKNTGLPTEKIYQYRVRATCTAGCGYSDWAGSGQTSTKVTDNTPGNVWLSANLINSNEIDLYFSSSNYLNNVQFYLERTTTESGPYVRIATLNFDQSSYKDIGLPIGTVFWYRIFAHNWAANSAYTTASASTPIPVSLPGRIQAEDYRIGGEGVGYHDLSAGNTGGVYRYEDVDVQACTDAGGGYNIGWAQAGEWLAYDVNVTSTGSYDLTMRLASGNAGTKTLTVTIDGSTVASFSTTDASGWQSWKDVKVPGVNLTAGVHLLKINESTGNYNINYLDVVKQVTTPGVLQLAASTYTAAENGGNVTLTVNRVNGSSGSVAVNYATANGTATAGSDYTAKSGTLTFAAGVTSQTVSIPIIDDAIVESNETFTVSLSSPTGGATLGSPTTGTVTITDNDAGSVIKLPGRVQAEDYKAGGEGVGYHDLTTGNTGGAYRTDNVDIEATSDAGSGYDVGWTQAGEWLAFDVNVTTSGLYDLTSRMASGNAGTKTMTVTLDGATIGTFNTTDASGWQSWKDVKVTGVNLTAGNHVLRMTMTTAGFNLNYLDVAAQVTTPGALQFSASTATVAENGGNVTLTVNRVNGSSGSVSVNYATANGTATAGSDYTAKSGTLTFAAGVTSQTVSIPIIDDAIVESNETFTVSLSSPTGGATLGSPTTGTVTITDNDGVVDLAKGKTATASSQENTTNTPPKAVDGNASTRWSSAYSDPQWIRVDLGASYTVKRVVLNWEAASAKNYTVQVSNDGSTWTTISTQTNKAAGARVDNLTGLSGTGRYVRMNGTARNTTYGYSLWSFEVYNN